MSKKNKKTAEATEAAEVKPAKKAAKTEAPVVTLASLGKCAAEMNKRMGLKPAIDVKAEEDALKASVLENAKEITAEDVFSAETVAVLTALGIKDVKVKSGAEKKAKAPVDKEAKAKKRNERWDLLDTLVTSGKHDRAALMEKMKAKFPDMAESTLVAMMSDCKNAKYSRLPDGKVATADDKGRYHYA